MKDVVKGFNEWQKQDIERMKNQVRKQELHDHIWSVLLITTVVGGLLLFIFNV
jgi:hypothetical protein